MRWELVLDPELMFDNGLTQVAVSGTAWGLIAVAHAAGRLAPLGADVENARPAAAGFAAPQTTSPGRW